MVVEEKKVILKDGRECRINSPMPADGAVVLDHLRRVFGETDFLLRYPEELVRTREQEEIYLEEQRKAVREVTITAWIEGELVGLLGIYPVGTVERCRHRASFGLSVQKPCWHLGLGRILVSEAIQAARSMGFEQLELEAVEGNDSAVSLYRSFGFQLYGTRERSFCYRDGRYAKEYLMSLFL